MSFGIEKNYCSESNLAQNGQNIEPQAQAVEVRGGFIGNYIFYEGFTNILYWLFGLYQKEPGLYWYKYYCSFGYRTCLLSNRFYFDFYMRTWIKIPVAFVALLFHIIIPVIYISMSQEDEVQEEVQQKVYDILSNFKKVLLCLIFVPVVDLNIRLGKKFYLVIGFKDIFAMSLYSKFIKLFF